MTDAALPFWWDAFDDATDHWNCFEVGVYMRLLCHQYKHGSIPNDPKQLATICSCQLGHFKVAWERYIHVKFMKCDDGKLRNRKAKTVRDSARQKAYWDASLRTFLDSYLEEGTITDEEFRKYTDDLRACSTMEQSQALLREIDMRHLGGRA